jgi:hypothetical protein
LFKKKEKKPGKPSNYVILEEDWYTIPAKKPVIEDCENCKQTDFYDGNATLEFKKGMINLPYKTITGDGKINLYSMENKSPISIGEGVKLNEIPSTIPKFLYSEADEEAKLITYGKNLPEKPRIDKTLISMLEGLGLLDKVKLKYTDDAYKHLTEILTQIKIGYETIDEALRTFTELSFDNEEKITASKQFLFKTKEGYLADHLNASRAHCRRIDYIYEEYLYKWFSSLPFTENEKKDLKELFEFKLRYSDSEYVEGMAEIVRFLETSSDLLYRLVELDRFRQASIMLKEFTTEIEEPKHKLHDKLSKLLSLQAEFVEKSIMSYKA